MLMFSSAFASNFNIVPMVMLMLMQRMVTELILCTCIVYHCFHYFENANADVNAKCEWAFRKACFSATFSVT